MWWAGAVAGQFLNDLHVFDPAASTWTDLSETISDTIEPRLSMGMAAMDGHLYVFGGYAGSGQRSKP